MERFMKTAAMVLFLFAVIPMAANAAQIKTPTVSTPHVNVKTSISTPNTNVGGGAGRGAGKVSTQDIHFTKTTDKSSPTFFKGVYSGKHINKAVITAR
jgi:Type VI secretion system effector, Hcp